MLLFIPPSPSHILCHCGLLPKERREESIFVFLKPVDFEGVKL
ncbi:hypothetical protein HMPREF1320_1769 [Capnocytophaga sp. oral taxon 335 str. F0486]|nr:hypothetical protein HMPREF1320_1769 [Capnocytophaga sp. oral taxon 335 str. F0486]